MRKQRIFVPLALSLVTSACSGDTESEPPSPIDGPSAPSGDCNVVTQSFTVSSNRHVADCSALPDEPKPPAGGDHYGVWAAYLTYDFPIAHGFSIHSMEHGAVVFSYNCPEGCDDEVQQAQALIDALAEDPLCYGTGSKRRAILLPDPTLDVRWGVSAWGHHLRADCVDNQAFTSFYDQHYAQTEENFCAWGVNFTSSPCP